MTLSIDFDLTTAYSTYPIIHALYPDAKYYINKLYDDGHIILFNSCRDDYPERKEFYKTEAKAFLNKNGVHYHEFNENSPELILKYQMDCRKLSADIYIDDKCLMGLPMKSYDSGYFYDELTEAENTLFQGMDIPDWQQIYNLISSRIH